MKHKQVPNKKLFEYHTCPIPGEIYPQNHAVRRDGKYVLFAGEHAQSTNMTWIIEHGELTDYNVLCLQIILSYGQKVSMIHYRTALRMLLSLDPKIMMDKLCHTLHCDAAWVKQMLQIPNYVDLNKTCVANAYAIGRLKDRCPKLEKFAEEQDPNEFLPRVLLHIKEAKKKR